MNVSTLKCPNCGASVSFEQTKCAYCNNNVFITSHSTVSTMNDAQINKFILSYKMALTQHPSNKNLNIATGLCLLKLGKYEQAINAFETAQLNGFDDANSFFYCAIARLKGRRPFLCQRTDIEKIENDIMVALSISPSSQHYYFLSIIRKDFYARKCLKIEPTWEYYRLQTVSLGITESDIRSFCELAHIPTILDIV